MRSMKARLGIGISSLVALLIGLTLWLGFSARSVVADLTAARTTSWPRRRPCPTGRSWRERRTRLRRQHAAAARSRTSSPIWGLATSLPVLGATPETVRAIAIGLDQAVGAMAPAVQSIVELRPSALVGSDGSVDGAAIATALPSLRDARAGVSAAADTLATAPSTSAGDVVVAPVDQARAELADELASLDGTFDTVIRAAEIAPPLLGMDEPKRYFVAILNPNESRGVGGFLGTWAIMTAESGRLTIAEVGSNNDLPGFTTLPVDLGDGLPVPLR